MGSGKTAVGKELSSLLGYSLVDFDFEMEKEEGMSIKKIFETRGEKYFRQLETEILKRFSKRSLVVASTGGGIIERDANRSCLKEEWTAIFLDAPFEILLPRIKGDPKRPKALTSTKKIECLYQKRWPLYKDVAKIQVRVSNMNTREIAEAIYKKLLEEEK